VVRIRVTRANALEEDVRDGRAAIESMCGEKRGVGCRRREREIKNNIEETS
jgi:hypothetical protein